MVPPKDPYIKVRVVGDIDRGIMMNDKATNFAPHSMHFLKRTDAEPYIARVCLFSSFCLVPLPPPPKTNKLIGLLV